MSDLETQLSQQRQLCFHELLEVFASDDHAQKQAASEQVAKFLEQCQAFLPTTSLSVLRGNPGDSLHLQGQPQETDSDQDQQQDQQSSKDPNIQGLMHDFDAGHNGCDHSLVLSANEHSGQKQQGSHCIADELQVICTSAEGQVIMASALDTASAVVRPEQDTDLDSVHNPATISVQPHGVEQPEQAAMLAQILGQSEQQGIEVQAVLPEMTADAGPGLVSQGDGTGLMSPECLMEVVAANGLASLGREVTAVTNTSDNDPHHQPQGTFMVTLDDGQGIIIQHAPGDPVHVEESSEEVGEQSNDEPNSKRIKISKC